MDDGTDKVVFNNIVQWILDHETLSELWVTEEEFYAVHRYITKMGFTVILHALEEIEPTILGCKIKYPKSGKREISFAELGRKLVRND